MKRTVCFGGETKESAGRWFRAEIPAKALRPTWSTSVANFALTPQTPAEQKRDPRIRGWNGVGSRIGKPASVVTLRIMDNVNPIDKDVHVASFADDIRRARDHGQRVVYDIDDDLWHIPEWSPAAKAMHTLVPTVRAYDLDAIGANISACDGVFCSTPYLQRVVEEQGFGVPTFLLRPGIDPSAYFKHDPPHERLRVGWMGSMSHHLPHLRTIWEALDVLKEFDAEFVRIGELRLDGSEYKLRDLPCRWSQKPWGSIGDLPAKLTDIDIGIIPRVPSEFNEGQSVTSGLQYGAAGIPFLVSPSSEYERLERLGAGKVCRTINDWRQALRDLLEFKTYREQEAELSREQVGIEFGLAATKRQYLPVLEGLIGDD